MFLIIAFQKKIQECNVGFFFLSTFGQEHKFET